MPHAQHALSLEAALHKDPQVRDCAVLPSQREGTACLLAFVVPRAALAAAPRFVVAEEHARSTGVANFVVPVERLPLRADGGIDHALLLGLTLPLESERSAAELALSQQPGVAHAAVFARTRSSIEARLHLDQLPGVSSTVEPAHDATQAADEVVADQTERPRALRHGAALQVSPGAPRTLPESLQRAASESTASLLFIEDDSSELRWTLRELHDEALRIMSGLRGQGLLPGAFVLLPISRPRDVLCAFWGCLLGGFVPAVLPVPASYTASSSELDKLRAVAALLGQPTLLATRETRAGLLELSELQSAPERVLCLDTLRASAASGQPHAAEPDDVAFLSLSSGSTGVPKCIQLTHRNILARGRASSALCAQSARDVVLNWLPFDHIGSISDWHLRCVELGCSMVYCSKTDPGLGEP